jgi:hypothetical protein
MRDSAGQVVWKVVINGKRYKRAYLLGTARRLAAEAQRRWPNAQIQILPY